MIPLNLQFHWPGTLIEIGTTLVLAVVCRFLLRKLVRHAMFKADQRMGEHTTAEMGRSAQMVSTSEGLGASRGARRTKTLGSVLMSIADIVLLIIVVLSILNSVNINIRPALASAGIVGVAIGIGAQSLVKDFFNGAFIIIEDQYGVGDIIEVGKLKGTVRSVGFRVTELQDFNGEVWYLRNGDISTVGNVSQGYSQSTFTLPVSIEEDPKRVTRALNRMLKRLDAEPDWHNKMLEEPMLLGLTDVDDITASYQITIKCPPNQQWTVEREIRARALTIFSQRGIRTPYQLISTIPSPSAESTADTPKTVRRRRLSHTARDARARAGTNYADAGEKTSVSPDAPSTAATGGQAAAGSTTDRQELSDVTHVQPRVTPRDSAGTPASPVPGRAPDHPAAAPDDRTGPEEEAWPADDSEQRSARDASGKAADATISTEGRKAQAWLDKGANRRVRWVSDTDTGHNMAAEDTMDLNTEDIVGDKKAKTKDKHSDDQ